MPYGGELTETKTTKNSYTLRGQFSYNKDLGTDEKHNISIALGGELSSMEYQNLNQIYRGYMPDRGKGMANFDPNVYGGYYNWYYTTAAARGIHSEERKERLLNQETFGNTSFLAFQRPENDHIGNTF